MFIIVHTIRQWCQRHAIDANKVILKLDFENAFNCVNRAAALQAMRTDERAAVEAVAELQQSLAASREASEDAASSVY